MTTTAPHDHNTTNRIPTSVTGKFLLVGAAAAALGTLLPWEQANGLLGTTISSGSMSSAGGVLLLALLGVAVWTGWPARIGELTKGRRFGLSVIIALLSVIAVGKFVAIAGDQNRYPGFGVHVGAGLLVYALGVACLWVGVVRTWSSHTSDAGTRERPS